MTIGKKIPYNKQMNYTYIEAIRILHLCIKNWFACTCICMYLYSLFCYDVHVHVYIIICSWWSSDFRLKFIIDLLWNNKTNWWKRCFWTVLFNKLFCSPPGSASNDMNTVLQNWKERMDFMHQEVTDTSQFIHTPWYKDQCYR